MKRLEVIEHQDVAGLPLKDRSMFHHHFRHSCGLVLIQGPVDAKPVKRGWHIEHFLSHLESRFINRRQQFKQARIGPSRAMNRPLRARKERHKSLRHLANDFTQLLKANL